MAKELFRKEALDRLSSPEALDKLLIVTKPRQWLALSGLLVLIAIGLIWAFTGNIVIRQSANAALVSSGGLDTIIVKQGGELRDVRFEAGDFINAGDVVARLNREDLVSQINALQHVANPTKDQTKHLAELRTTLDQESVVISKESGRVVRVNAEAGDILNPAFPLIELSVMGNQVKNLVGVLYVPLSQGRLVKPGMPVYIYPSMVKKEEYGYMVGRVNEISQFSVDRSEIKKMIGSDELITYLTRNQAVLEVLVDLQLDPKTYSGYAWSSSQGPDLQLESETLCTADIILGSKKPIELILPTFSKWL